MITAIKGNSRIICTLGTFEEQLEPLGYRLASEENEEATKEVASLLEKEEDKQENTLFEEEQEDLSEKFGLKNKKTSISKKGK